VLQITIPAAVVEDYNEETNEFIYTTVAKEQTLQLEHSLVSLSKWESKWCKPFLSKREKTTEEILDYIKYMTLTQNVKPDIYDRLTEENIDQINKYIDAPMTATTFSKESTKGGAQEIVTAELIYYWMIALNIPFECQKWHLNRLLTLVKVCNIKNSPPKKMSKRETASRYAKLNAARRKQHNTRG
jgi:hypothetical protein